MEQSLEGIAALRHWNINPKRTVTMTNLLTWVNLPMPSVKHFHLEIFHLGTC